MPDIIKEDELNQQVTYRAGGHVWMVEGNMLITTHDTRGGINSGEPRRYKNFDQAADAAWRMACMQMRA